jgi:hypothetical protein
MLLSHVVAPSATEASPDQIHKAIRTRFPMLPNPVCGKPLICGNVASIDCSSEVDGPLFYFDNSTGALIMVCGGSCESPDPNDPASCKSCPPKEWACAEGHNRR